MRCVRLGLLLILLVPAIAIGQATMGGWNPDEIEKANATIDTFKVRYPKLDSYFKAAYGWAVFSNVGKAAFIVGGAHGTGIVYVGGQPKGRTALTQGSVGFQFGGQAFSELVFFEDEAAFKRFANGKVKLAAKATATLITEGGAVDLAWSEGIAVFTMTKGGLMVDASVGGQGFTYEPLPAGDSTGAKEAKEAKEAEEAKQE